MNNHIPVLLDEVIDNLITDREGIYIDGTFGRGGHSKAILNALGKNGVLLGIDKDPEAIATGKELQNKEHRFHIEQGSFGDMAAMAEKHQLAGKISGIFLDLGVSSPQLDDPKRGFSFLREGPLDMRMDPSQGVDAATWINSAKESDIADVLKQYGEERYARRIAGAICRARTEAAITTTTQLSEIVTKANPNWERHKHPATRSFQGIRIFINRELDALQAGLEQSLPLLKMGGRIAVISFHSLEDRIVKHYIRDHVRGKSVPKGVPIRDEDLKKELRKIGRAIRASDQEVRENARSRSAIFRVAEKIG